MKLRRWLILAFVSGMAVMHVADAPCLRGADAKVRR